MDGIFGLIGVLVGSCITWLQAYCAKRQETKKNARFLAIRVEVCLSRFVIDCINVVNDDGLSFGQPQADGSLEPQVAEPGPPSYPTDVDWRSIEYELMYKILSLQFEVERVDEIIRATRNISGPPDNKELFDARKYYYSLMGMKAYQLSKELSDKYKILKNSDHNKIHNTRFCDFKNKLQHKFIDE